MRSTIGTKSRMAAHIIALILLIVFMVCARPPAGTAVPRPATSTHPSVHPADAPAKAIGAPTDPTATLAKVVTPVTASHVPAEQLRPPGAEGAVSSARPPSQPGIGSHRPAPAETLATAVPGVEASTDPLRPPADQASAAMIEEPAPSESPAPEAIVQADPEAVETAEPSPAPVPAEAPAPQPDESGSVVVDAADTGAEGPVAVTAPLANANLEVLGDNVYWLDQKYDLERELSVIPEMGTLIVLTPIPGRTIDGFEHVKTVTIPANIDDLNHDAAEHYVHLTSDASQPVVTAVLPGVRGAAYFKAAYFLAHRNTPIGDLMPELEQELEEAGPARDDVMHRIERLKD